ncbi:MAG TPA: FAD-dependent oxidoreductase [Anaerolineales bacterium]|nr:FAD-dependent oxidoreductase [Anaerolineales bacterium]
MNNQNYEALVIGFGKGGKTLASYLGNQGIEVAVIEQSKAMYGGTCINIACIPSKALALAAEGAYKSKFDTFEEKEAYYQKSLAEKDELVSFLRQRNYDNLNNNPHVTVIDGKASFITPNTVQVDKSNGEDAPLGIHAEKIFINTGSLPFMPAIEGLQESQRIFTSTSLMELQQLPRKLVIIGGGYIGLEFASIYAGFGSNVTLLERNETLLRSQDRDIAEAVKTALEKRGVQFLMGASAQKIYDQDDRAIVEILDHENHQKQLSANAILVAVGRVPNTLGLGLENAGIQVDARGFIVVDDFLRASVPNIWALGDVNGGPQFTYISLDDYRIVRGQLDGNTNNPRSLKDRLNIPYSIFIHPTLSNIGLSESEALQAGYQIQVVKMPAAAVPRAQQLHETQGLLKAIVDTETGSILGCSLFCSDSSEVINVVQMAMQTGASYETLRDSIYTHPSMTESLNDLLSQVQLGTVLPP